MRQVQHAKLDPMNTLIQLFLGMSVMLAIDIPFMRYVMLPLNKKTSPEAITDKPNIVPAVIFYTGYVPFVFLFLSKIGGDTPQQAMYGALLGMFAYSTYELTNKGIVKEWTWKVAVFDILWGTTLTGLIATVMSIVR